MDSTKRNFLIAIIIIALLIIIAAVKAHKKSAAPISTPQTVSSPAENNDKIYVEQTPEGNQEVYDINDPDLPLPPGLREQEGPNALDVMAPGRKNARERIKKVQELRKQALDAQEQDLQNIGR